MIEHRHGFNKLVVMCANHSRLVDDPEQGYTIERMLRIKSEHETAIARRRTRQELRDAQASLSYARIVDEWEQRFSVDDWDARMSPLVGDGHPRLAVEHFDTLQAGGSWLFDRVWPGTDRELEGAFENFRVVLQDLLRVLEHHPHETLRESGLVALARFYNDPKYCRRPGVDHDLLDRWYDYYSALVEDLAFELTRAANLVCDTVRRRLDPRYRLEDGVVTITQGPFMDFSFSRLRPHYVAGSGPTPYEGLSEFMTARATRDIVRGEGEPPEGLRLPRRGVSGSLVRHASRGRRQVSE